MIYVCSSSFVGSPRPVDENYSKKFLESNYVLEYGLSLRDSLTMNLLFHQQHFFLLNEICPLRLNNQLRRSSAKGGQVNSYITFCLNEQQTDHQYPDVNPSVISNFKRYEPIEPYLVIFEKHKTKFCLLLITGIYR
jgi:hypothetical protein